MNEEEKKATKMLDKFITEHKFYNIKHSDNLEDNIEIVLNLIEKLQKENKKLKNKLLDTLEGQKVIKEETPQYIKENYIPIQKVKDKIEEEKLPLTIVGGRKNKKTLEYGIKLGRRQALQELIEEREEK